MVNGPHCAGCPHQSAGVRFIPPDGTGANGILLAGDSPWLTEIKEGRPFVGASGWLLDRVFAMLGVDRSSFLITNAAIQCKPSHLGWTDHPERYPDAALAIAHCRPHFDDMVARHAPKLIVTLGNVALQRVAGVSGLDLRHSYLHSSPFGVPVLPTYHPSFILQGNQKYTSVLLFALQRAIDYVTGAYQPTHYDLLLDPPIDVVEYYLRGAASAPEVICDIETPNSSKVDEEEAEEDPSYTIIRISFSVGGQETGGENKVCPVSAISFPWQPPYSDAALQCLRSARRLVFWNQSFDLPRLLAAGATPSGDVVDAMWAWHFLQSDLPKALGFVAPFYYCGPPWKHLSSAQPAYYSAMDSAVTRTVYEGIRRDLVQQGRWEVFERHCIQVGPILARMGQAGIRVDQQQQAAFMTRMQAEYDDSYRVLQTMIPAEVKGRKLYKRPPKDMTDVIELEEPPNAADE